MAHPKASQKRARAISSSFFLIGLAILSILGQWWPGILLVIGIPLAFRQFLLGKIYDAFLSLVIFVGAFVATRYEISWEILMPVLFVIAALYILIREFCSPRETPEPEIEESLNKEIEEDLEDV